MKKNTSSNFTGSEYIPPLPVFLTFCVWVWLFGDTPLCRFRVLIVEFRSEKKENPSGLKLGKNDKLKQGFDWRQQVFTVFNLNQDLNRKISEAISAVSTRERRQSWIVFKWWSFDSIIVISEFDGFDQLTKLLLYG